MNRKKFILESLALSAMPGLLQQCRMAGKHVIRGQISGANSTIGHLLRDPAVTGRKPDEIIETGTLVVGGGVSGLSAARRLLQQGRKDFILIELDKQPGGNAACGSNEVSAYPYGAHYIPLPNNELTEYLQFLEECGVITGYDAEGLPHINELYLCFDPQERLYIHGYWQEGIIPAFGLPDSELQQIKRFLAEMDGFRKAKGADGKEAFSIPVDSSSNDEQFLQLDRISMHDWLLQNNYNAPGLHWYINYCCRDDFGTDYRQASAWAGIHYFAGRKGLAANAAPQSVITWPEGNGWLVQQMQKKIAPYILPGTVALNVDTTGEGVTVKVLEVATKKIKAIHAKTCILATPQFVNSRLLAADDARKKTIADHFVYQPWMVANITSRKLTERSGAGLSWDNVLYKGRGLGYVEATHQLIGYQGPKQVLTYYLPLTEKKAAEERTAAQKRSFEDWVSLIREDLLAAHPDFDEMIDEVDVWVWGHGMISPQRNFIHGAVRKQMQQPLAGKVYFAHSDLSGISVFEEAFYQGLKAADAVLQA